MALSDAIKPAIKGVTVMSRLHSSLFAVALLAMVSAPSAGFAQDVDPAAAAQAQSDKAAAKAASRLAAARKKLAKAEKGIVDANDLQLASAEGGQVAAVDFRKLCKSPPEFSSSRDAQDWARKVSAAAKRWTNADGRKTKGAKNLERATRDKDKAEAEIIRSQAEFDRARSGTGLIPQ